MNTRFLKHVAALVAAGTLAAPTFAAQETFSLAWSGAQFGNDAQATGSITMDPSAFTIGSQSNIDMSKVSALTLTITDASVGNGTFTLSDFSAMYAASPSALDFSRQLVGQPVDGGYAWGTNSPELSGQAGDFNLFTNIQAAPTGTWYFTLTTEDGHGDAMALTSMTAAVPEASNVALMLAGLGVVGLLSRRRRTQG